MDEIPHIYIFQNTDKESDPSILICNYHVPGYANHQFSLYLISFFFHFQVIKAFNNPDFFNRTFPMLHEVSSQAYVSKSTSSLNSSGGTGNVNNLKLSSYC